MSNQSIVEKSIIEQASNDIIEVEKGNLQDLKQAATIFINKVLEKYQNAIRTLTIIETQKLNTGLQYFYQYMRENTNFTQNILSLQHIFETQVNDFLFIKINLAWVSNDGHIKYYDEAFLGNFYKKAFGQFGRGGISGSAINSVDSNIEQNLLDKFQNAEAERIDVYLEIKTRWSESKNIKCFYYHGYYRDWNRRKYSQRFPNLGGIAEKYVETVINEDSNVSSANLQPSIRYFAQHTHLNSIGGLIKGDVKFNESNGKIHFAVKEGSFSTAKFGQYFSLAQHLKNVSSLTEEDLKELIKIDSVVQDVLKESYEKAIETMDSEIKILEKTI